MNGDTELLPACDPEIYEVLTRAAGPVGSLPLTEEMPRESPSGDLFGLTQDAGMGWTPSELGRKEYLILSTQGGIGRPTDRQRQGITPALGGRPADGGGSPHDSQECWNPFAAFVSDPCDGRTQGTPGMMDSPPYRNDAATVLRRLIRSSPTRRGVLGVAICDKDSPP